MQMAANQAWMGLRAVTAKRSATISGMLIRLNMMENCLHMPAAPMKYLGITNPDNQYSHRMAHWFRRLAI